METKRVLKGQNLKYIWHFFNKQAQFLSQQDRGKYNVTVTETDLHWSANTYCVYCLMFVQSRVIIANCKNPLFSRFCGASNLYCIIWASCRLIAWRCRHRCVFSGHTKGKYIYFCCSKFLFKYFVTKNKQNTTFINKGLKS